MWPRPSSQGPPLQDEAARRILEDASQQLASGNPAQSLQVRPQSLIVGGKGKSRRSLAFSFTLILHICRLY